MIGGIQTIPIYFCGLWHCFIVYRHSLWDSGMGPYLREEHEAITRHHAQNEWSNFGAKYIKILKSSLVGGIPTPLKKMTVSWDDYSQYMDK